MEDDTPTKVERTEEMGELRGRVDPREDATTGGQWPESYPVKMQEEYQAILDSTSTRVWCFDTEGKTLFVNRAVMQDLSFPDYALRGKRLSDLFSSEDAVRRAVDNRRIVDSGKPMLQVIEPVTLPNGERRWCESDKIPYFNKEGDIAGIVILTVDITERVKAEEALRTSKIRLSDAMDLARIVYWEFDTETLTYAFNDPFYAFYGTTAQREGGYLMGMEEYVKRFIHPDDIPAFYHAAELYKEARDPSLPVDIEHRIVRRDGDVRHVIARGRGLADADGRLIKYFGANQDITDRVRAEAEKEHLRSQLLQAQKMEAIGTLAGGIAHDFNNILTVLIGYGSMLQMKIEDDDPRKEYVKQILASSERAAQLVRGLLAFSRKQRVDLRPYKIDDIIEDALKLLRRLLAEDVELRIVLSGENPTIIADIAQLSQILMNLVTNARDAMPTGGVLTIGTRLVTIDEEFSKDQTDVTPGRYVLISVSDTGIGMSKATMERVFEPFFTTKEVGKGTGLGLSSVYGIVKQHGGHIWVSSSPGQGAVFEVYLPLADRQDE